MPAAPSDLLAPAGLGIPAPPPPVVGISTAPRIFATAEARVRWMPSLYASAVIGTAYRPAPSGGLQRALTAGLGVGADFELRR